MRPCRGLTLTPRGDPLTTKKRIGEGVTSPFHYLLLNPRRLLADVHNCGVAVSPKSLGA
ncbi:MAG: hypothetical protein QXT27_00995 [Pyrobaculum sp.]